MHHRRIRLTVQSIFPGPKPGQTAGPGGRRLHRRCDLKTDQMLQNADKCCHVEGTERASSGEYNVRSASSSWNDEKCGGWTLGCMSTASGGGETGVRLSQSEETLRTGCAIKHFRGTFSASHSRWNHATWPWTDGSLCGANRSFISTWLRHLCVPGCKL